MGTFFSVYSAPLRDLLCTYFYFYYIVVIEDVQQPACCVPYSARQPNTVTGEWLFSSGDQTKHIKNLKRCFILFQEEFMKYK